MPMIALVVIVNDLMSLQKTNNYYLFVLIPILLVLVILIGCKCDTKDKDDEKKN